MSTVVQQVTKNQLSTLQKKYQNYLLGKTPPYSFFSAKKNGVTITAYNSGKVVFQGNNAESEAAACGLTTTPSAPTKKAKSAHSTNRLPADFDTWSVLGSDEVGNGSYFGPLVTVAAYAEKSQLNTLKALGVKDSKLLTDPQIQTIAKKLITIIPYQPLVLTPEKYNQVQQQHNAVAMKVLLHHQALTLLQQKLVSTPQAILIDAFTTEKNFQQYLHKEQRSFSLPTYFVTKGEQHHLAVAVASIIARHLFLEALKEESAACGILLPSGAGNKSDQVAVKLLEQGGLPLLGRYAKLHFANTEKALKLWRK